MKLSRLMLHAGLDWRSMRVPLAFITRGAVVLPLIVVILSTSLLFPQLETTALRWAVVLVASIACSVAVANVELQQSLLKQATHDPLTNLFNRRYLRDVVTDYAADHPVAVIMLDIDHFKWLNDTYGHAEGDRVLAAVGRVIARNARASDIACRYGGEEFAIILPSATLEVGVRRAEQMLEAVRRLTEGWSTQVMHPVTVSAGVAALPDQGQSLDVVLQSADRALYEAKTQGRNRVVAAGAVSVKPIVTRRLPSRRVTEVRAIAARELSLSGAGGTRRSTPPPSSR